MKSFGVQKFNGLLFAGSFAAVAEYLMGFLGSVVSGHLLGEEALAGIALLTPVVQLTVFVSALVGNGMGIVYSQRRGQLDVRGAQHAFMQAVWTALALGGALAAALVFGREAYFAFMAPTAPVAAAARDYWTTFIPVVFLNPFVLLFLNCCYVDGDVRLCSVAYVVQLVVNLACSVGLVCAGFGTAGCGWGVTCGYAASALVLAGHFLRRSNTFHWAPCFAGRDTFRLLAASFGDASGYVSDAIVYLFLGKVLVAAYGSPALAVMSAVLGALGLLAISGGIAVAAQPIVTVYFGEGNFKSIRTVMRQAFRATFLAGAALTAAFALAPDLALAMVGIDDAALVPWARQAVRLTAIGFLPYVFSNVLNNYYQYVAREGLAVALSFWGWLIVPLAALPLFAKFTAVGFWWWFPATRFLSFGLFLAFLAWRYGRKVFPLLLPHESDAGVAVFNLRLADRAIVDVSTQVAARLREVGADARQILRAQLMTEEVLMAVKDRNRGKSVLTEVTLDTNDGIRLTLRDDGEIFDITDADAKVNGLRTFLVASVMERQRSKANLITTGFNRNVFRF